MLGVAKLACLDNFPTLFYQSGLALGSLQLTLNEIGYINPPSIERFWARHVAEIKSIHMF